MTTEAELFAAYESLGETVLEHYGVKGMKWGVRKDDKTGGQTGSGEEFIPVAVAVGIYAALFGGMAVYNAKDGGTFNQRKTKNVPWKVNDGLKGKKSVKEIEKDVVKQINPGFGAKGTKMNCRRCTFAYELRRRGLDVNATKSQMATGQTVFGLETAIKGNIRTFESMWGQKQISNPMAMSTATPQQKSEAVFKALGKEPNGSRGELGVAWKFGGGHSMAYEVVNNKPVIFDTQSGVTYQSAKDFNKFSEIMTDAAHTRLDNVDLDEGFLRKWVKNVD